MTRKTITLTTAAIIVSAALSTAAMAHGSGGPGQATMASAQSAGQNAGQSMGNKGPGGPGAQAMTPAKGMNMMKVAMRSMMKDHDANKPLDKPLTIGDVQTQLKQYLQHRGNDRLKIGDVTKLDDKTIVAQIVTKDGSVVEQFKIDKKTGRWTSDNK